MRGSMKDRNLSDHGSYTGTGAAPSLRTNARTRAPALSKNFTVLLPVDPVDPVTKNIFDMVSSFCASIRDALHFGCVSYSKCYKKTSRRRYLVIEEPFRGLLSSKTMDEECE